VNLYSKLSGVGANASIIPDVIIASDIRLLTADNHCDTSARRHRVKIAVITPFSGVPSYHPTPVRRTTRQPISTYSPSCFGADLLLITLAKLLNKNYFFSDDNLFNEKTVRQ